MIPHALTVDLEEWFHVLNLRRLAPPERWDTLERRSAAPVRALLALFERRGVRATFFCLGWLAEREPALIEEISAAGHEIASHGYAHRFPADLGRGRFREDLERAGDILAGITGKSPEGYRACTFGVTPATAWVLEELAAAGYRYDSSIYPVRHPDYGWPGFPRRPVRVSTGRGALLELPPLTVAFLGRAWPVGGGGYLRLLPAWVLSAALRVWERAGHPGSLYLHPWELDPGQPRMPVGGLRAFRHYLNLDKTAARLDALLARHAFAPMGVVAAALAGEEPATFRVDP